MVRWAFAAVAALAACQAERVGGADVGADVGDGADVGEVIGDRPSAPELGVYLDQAPGLRAVSDPRIEGGDPIARDGLIPAAMLDANGKPLTGPGQHASLDESDAVYATLNERGDYAPDTFDAWKARFGFPPREVGESLESWRERAGVYVYNNVNELGLGRELGCIPFADEDDDGEPATGLACFVSNYGQTFSNLDAAFDDAVRGEPRRNTVCLAYIPSLPAGYEIQFFVYGPTDQRQTWAQLDHMGPRPHPQVCTGCHGGEHDTALHLTRDARFLPTQPSHLAFGDAPPYDRATQEERVRRVNAMALAAGDHGNPTLTAFQREWLVGLYPDGIDTPGARMSPTWVPAGWRTSERDAAVWNQVIDPFCVTCHGALDDGAMERVLTPEAARESVAMSVCSVFSMPNAQATAHHLWRDAPIDVDGVRYDSPAAALIAWADVECVGLGDRRGCERHGERVHDLCGNAHSGSVCLADGTCGPDLIAVPTADYAEPIGYCTRDGARACPAGQECRDLDRTPDDGWDGGGCFVCGAPGQPVCGPPG